MIRHYIAAAETRDILHSHPSLSNIAEHRLAPEQSRKTDNEYQKIECTSSASGTFPVGRQQLVANPMLAMLSPMNGSSIGEKGFATKNPINQPSIRTP